MNDLAYELVNGNAKYEIVENGVVVSMLLAGSGTESDPYQIASSADLEIHKVFPRSTELLQEKI